MIAISGPNLVDAGACKSTLASHLTFFFYVEVAQKIGERDASTPFGRIVGKSGLRRMYSPTKIP